MKLQNSPLWYISSWLVNLKRRLVNWRGDGVHSPYAFRMIRDVFRTPYPYSAFRYLYRKQRASELQHQQGVRLMTERRTLELVFRLVHQHAPRALYLMTATESLLPAYVQATGYAHYTTELSEAEVIVLEEHIPETLANYLKEHHPERLLILIYIMNPTLRAWCARERALINPPIVFKTTQLEAWVWRPATTPGVYPVYY